jgi:hypothetical protein
MACMQPSSAPPGHEPGLKKIPEQGMLSWVHYCQSCDTPVAMEPRHGCAVCPECGREGDAALGPLFVVTGASGSGKTAVLAPLARRLQGRCITFDADLLMDAAGALSDGQPISWPTFRDMWLAVAHGVTQSGLPTVLPGPFIPGHLQDLPARRWIGDRIDTSSDRPEGTAAAIAAWIDGHLAGTGTGTPAR